MIHEKFAPIGASFGDAYPVNLNELQLVFTLLPPDDAFDVIYSNDQTNVYRRFSDVTAGLIHEYNLFFFAELIDQDQYLATCGTIRTSDPHKVFEYEKVGKRILYNAIRQHWNVRF